MIALLRDIAQEHHRLENEFDLFKVGCALLNGHLDHWDARDFARSLVEMEKLNPSWPFTVTYAILMALWGAPWVRERFVYHLTKDLDESNWRSPYPQGGQVPYPYEGYFQNDLAVPLHLGLLASLCPDKRDDCFAALVNWQGPADVHGYKRLSLERLPPDTSFDGFFYGPAAYMWAMTAGLTDHTDGAANWAVAQLLYLMEGRSLTAGGCAAVWVLHVCACIPELNGEYEKARSFLNALGGIPREVLLDPPRFGVTIEADPQIAIPPAEELTSWVRCSNNRPPRSAVTSVLNEMIDHEGYGTTGSSRGLMAWLHRDREDQRFDRSNPIALFHR